MNKTILVLFLVLQGAMARSQTLLCFSNPSERSNMLKIELLSSGGSDVVYQLGGTITPFDWEKIEKSGSPRLTKFEFSLVGPLGEEAVLTLSQMRLISRGGCGRGGCPSLEPTTSAFLQYQGKETFFDCHAANP